MYDTHYPGFCYKRNGEYRIPVSQNNVPVMSFDVSFGSFRKKKCRRHFKHFTSNILQTSSKLISAHYTFCLLNQFTLLSISLSTYFQRSYIKKLYFIVDAKPCLSFCCSIKNLVQSSYNLHKTYRNFCKLSVPRKSIRLNSD